MWSILRRDERGSTLVEAAVIFPVVLTLTFGVMEFGNAFYQWILAEKATQHGVRHAVTSRMIATGVPDCGVATSEPAGTPCRLVAGSTTWSRTCTSAGGSGCDGTAFNALVAQMQSVYPRITAANVVIEYSGLGLGFVGRGSPVPNVTVSLRNMTFNFVALDGLAGLRSIPMPDFRAALSGEDLQS